jgi:hypothetical protein
MTPQEILTQAKFYFGKNRTKLREYGQRQNEKNK